MYQATWKSALAVAGNVTPARIKANMLTGDKRSRLQIKNRKSGVSHWY